MDKKTKNGIITVGVVAVLGIAAYKLLRKPKDTSGGTPNPNPYPNPNPNGGVVIGGVVIGGGTNTRVTINAQKLADDIFEAMDGWQTDEQKVKDAFNLLQTQEDLDALIVAYGYRKLNSGIWGVPDFSGDLVASLKDEHDNSEMYDINKILEEKGINKRYGIDL